jgi:hypothetical protein
MPKQRINTVIHKTEIVLAMITLIAVAVFSFNSLSSIFTADWSAVDTWYTFVNIVLTIVVGIELAKLLITHDLVSIKDVLIFVVARKMLSPDQTSMDILLAVLAFAVLFGLSMLNKKTELIEKNEKNLLGK